MHEEDVSHTAKANSSTNKVRARTTERPYPLYCINMLARILDAPATEMRSLRLSSYSLLFAAKEGSGNYRRRNGAGNPRGKVHTVHTEMTHLHFMPSMRSQYWQSAAPPAMVPNRYGLISMIFFTC